MTDALETTIVYVLVWFVVFPAIVTALIAVAVVRTIGERRQNQDNWKYRSRGPRLVRRVSLARPGCPGRAATP